MKSKNARLLSAFDAKLDWRDEIQGAMSKIYVGNVAFDHDPQDFEALFAKFGPISQCAAKRGFAFIHYENADDAAAAVKDMDGQEWHGRRLRVAFSTSSGSNGERSTRESTRDEGRNATVSRNLFVANISPEVKLSELEEFFEQYGRVENVKILPQARGNVSMSAFVDFEDIAAAEKAFASELVLAGQRLRTDYNIRKDMRRQDDFDSRDRRYDSRDRDHRDDMRGRRDSYDERSSYHSRPRPRSRSRSREGRNGRSDRYSTRPAYDRDAGYRDSPRRMDRDRGYTRRSPSPRRDYRDRSPPRR
ncbi:hypothetical protein Poli38472_014786 [Pythium oligandrum]|uniref:RRM domain-containing protein n=1 Tax=Pythium oligandrum TaxID=41045 RepID=A0A8K1CHW1_PYTOL|nr:hypothetical protein Poli38472_014786 [Pythium oligandrum]|eukprot:TMW63876.1 hypothetical protein Poli38472_014786 [Pythium oligandrum]